MKSNRPLGIDIPPHGATGHATGRGCEPAHASQKRALGKPLFPRPYSFAGRQGGGGRRVAARHDSAVSSDRPRARACRGPWWRRYLPGSAAAVRARPDSSRCRTCRTSRARRAAGALSCSAIEAQHRLDVGRRHLLRHGGVVAERSQLPRNLLDPLRRRARVADQHARDEPHRQPILVAARPRHRRRLAERQDERVVRGGARRRGEGVGPGLRRGPRQDAVEAEAVERAFGDLARPYRLRAGRCPSSGSSSVPISR